MASKALATTALLLSLNLLFFTMVSSTYCPPPSKPKGHKNPPKTPTTPKTPKTPKTPSTPSTPPSISPPSQASCPSDALKLGVCANLLNDLVHLVVGTPSKEPCCALLQGLADLQAAVCLCTALKANVLGLNLNIPISLSLLLNYCGNGVPAGFKCA